MMERAYFAACLVLGQLLRSARYSKISITQRDGRTQVRKHRSFYAPLLIVMGALVVKVLGTGTRVLTQREWEERERIIYQRFHGISIEVDAGGMLVLPYLAGTTLAGVLDAADLQESIQKEAIEASVVALAEFHRLGFTHADAMAENVLVDAGAAHWIDFETAHDSNRPLAWRRADDLRALLSTVLIRTVPGKRAEILRLILDAYADDEVSRVLPMSFTSVWRRSLSFHLAQARMSFQGFREISRLLRERTKGVNQ
jgi:tRNA A-37 threonylcarbamoyl transferase component Bud32